jgi:hypothetical protein
VHGERQHQGHRRGRWSASCGLKRMVSVRVPSPHRPEPQLSPDRGVDGILDRSRPRPLPEHRPFMRTGLVGSSDQAGLLARGSFSRRAFPSGITGQWRMRRSSPLTVAGQRGLRTPFPLGPELMGPDRAVADTAARIRSQQSDACSGVSMRL